MKQKLAFSSLLLALSLASAPTARAITTWYVNGVNGSDSNNCQSSSTPCKTIGCAISLASSGDSIMVAAATYKENLIIGLSLNVLGSGAGTTIIDGGRVNTVITVSSANAHVNLSKLTIQNGGGYHYGGGINSSGTLAISNSIITQNGGTGGGGIYNTGTLSVNSSTISRNSVGSFWHPASGAGISNGGTATINNSTISGNYAVGAGGGIESAGWLTINNSTLSGNASQFSYGSAIFSGGWTAINNSTISGNGQQHDHGCIIKGRGVNLSNTTISGNFAGSGYVALCVTASIQNSIIANNSGGNCGSGVTSNGYNMSSDATCNFSNRGDRNNTDPLLGLLQNNGGPTQTMALQPGSPAIDAGNPSGCTDGNGHLLTTDQRGYPRHDPEDTGGCDMGAYEKQTD